MPAGEVLSASEFASLREITRGFGHGAIPETDALRLIELRFIYMLLGDLRITTAGRVRALKDF